MPAREQSGEQPALKEALRDCWLTLEPSAL
jgi:hypothetical protein